MNHQLIERMLELAQHTAQESVGLERVACVETLLCRSIEQLDQENAELRGRLTRLEEACAGLLAKG